jgi:hypothetical protein
MWVMWNLTSVCLDILLQSVPDRCTVCAKCTIGSKIILDTPDGTPNRRGSSGSTFGPFGDSANLDAREVHGLLQTYHRLEHCF